MAINESKHIFATFVDINSRQFMSNLCLLKSGVYKEGPLMEKEIEPNQQFSDIPLPHNKPGSLDNGSVVKYLSKGTSKTEVIANGLR